MAAPRGSTLQSRFGFQDKDLTTPRHDEIMLWLDDNVERLIDEAFPPTDEGWDVSSADMYDHLRRSKHRPAMLAALTPHLPARPPRRIAARWEAPVMTRGDYMVGFVDMQVTVEAPELFMTDDTAIALDAVTAKRAHEDLPAQALEDAIPADPFGVSMVRELTVNIEVKTKIPSLGELIRQIRMYQQYLGVRDEHRFVVVSPDARFREAIERQGILFWGCP